MSDVLGPLLLIAGASTLGFVFDWLINPRSN